MVDVLPYRMVVKGNLRRVRTLAGVKFFGAPIGTIITPGMAFKARQTHGDDALQYQLEVEDAAPIPSTDLAVPGQATGLTRDYVAVPQMHGMEGMEERARRQRELQRLRRQAFGKKSPVDGDGDGWVYDADKYRKRPATPAEMAAGAALRAKKGGGGKGAGGAKGAQRPTTTRPSGAGTSIKPGHPKYDARVKEYDDKIAAAKNDDDLQRIVAKLQKDLILNDEDYHKVLDRVEAKSTGRTPPSTPTPAKKVPEAGAPETPPTKSVLERAKEKFGSGFKRVRAKPKERGETPVEESPEETRAQKKARQVDKMRSQIKNAQADDDLRRAIANLDHPGLTSPDKLQLISDIRAKNEEFKQADTAARAKTLMKRPVGAMPTFHPGDDDPKVFEEHRAFFEDDENSIANAKSEGLWNFILGDDRFKVEANSKAGNATNFWVTDSRNGERYMFKSTFFDGFNNPEKTEETMNDFLASDMLGDAGIKAAPTILASVPGEYPAMMAQRDWTQLHAPDAKVFDHAIFGNGFFEPHPKQGRGDVSANAWQLSDSALEKIKRGPNPDVGVEMVLTDYLFNNSLDRHGNNFLMVEHKDGSYEMGIIDHGMAFGTPPAVTDDPDSDWEMDSFDFFGMYKAFRPEEDGSWNLQRLVAYMAEDDRGKLKSQVQAALKKFSQVDAYEAYDRAASKDLNKDQLKYLDEWLGEYQWRFEWLNDNLDQFIDDLASEGGF